jgi:hypothetical protein
LFFSSASRTRWRKTIRSISSGKCSVVLKGIYAEVVLNLFFLRQHGRKTSRIERQQDRPITTPVRRCSRRAGRDGCGSAGCAAACHRLSPSSCRQTSSSLVPSYLIYPPHVLTATSHMNFPYQHLSPVPALSFKYDVTNVKLSRRTRSILVRYMSASRLGLVEPQVLVQVMQQARMPIHK